MDASCSLHLCFHVPRASGLFFVETVEGSSPMSLVIRMGMDYHNMFMNLDSGGVNMVLFCIHHADFMSKCKKWFVYYVYLCILFAFLASLVCYSAAYFRRLILGENIDRNRQS